MRSGPANLPLLVVGASLGWEETFGLGEVLGEGQSPVRPGVAMIFLQGAAQLGENCRAQSGLARIMAREFEENR